MAIFVEHVDMFNINDPNPNPNTKPHPKSNPNVTICRKDTRKMQSVVASSPKTDVFAI